MPAVAKNVNGVVMTSSPGPQSRARSASSSASVPFAQPTAILRVRQLGDRRLQLLHGGAEDEQLRVDDLHHRGNDFIADRGVLRAQIEQGDRHCRDRKSVIAHGVRAAGHSRLPRAPAKLIGSGYSVNLARRFSSGSGTSRPVFADS